VGPPEATEISFGQDAVDAALTDALSRLPPAKAVGEVAKLMQLDRQMLYARAMELQGK
jgi:16S rRNA (cytidine1402-2'-O)-methyltransferase